jgi:hypothetical protein
VSAIEVLKLIDTCGWRHRTGNNPAEFNRNEVCQSFGHAVAGFANGDHCYPLKRSQVVMTTAGLKHSMIETNAAAKGPANLALR